MILWCHLVSTARLNLKHLYYSCVGPSYCNAHIYTVTLLGTRVPFDTNI